MLATAFFVLAPSLVAAQDPSSSWLTYAQYKDPSNRMITAVRTEWTVPSVPSDPVGSNAPGWWFGVQTAKGDGALVQPILAYGYMGDFYSIFNGVFDWTDQSWHTSDTITVKPGDKIISSLSTSDNGKSYDMNITSTQTGRHVATNYKIERKQTEVESVAYFVLEHQPETCDAYPTSGECTFNNVQVEVEGQLVQNPTWEAKQERPACKSKTTIVDSSTIKITWDATSSEEVMVSQTAPLKWGTTSKSIQAPQAQCKKASYAFCCEVGKPCDCTKGTTAPGQCEQSSYAFCCSVGTPCDCSQPPLDGNATAAIVV